MRHLLAVLWVSTVPFITARNAAQKEADDYPLTRVVKLLQEMQKDLEGEMKSGTEEFEKMRCWCETNEAAKSKAVEEARSQIDELQTTIQTEAGKVGELSTEIETIKENIAASKKALAEATAVREKESAEFHESEKELIQSITLLHGAIEALSKHHPSSSMLQSARADAWRPSLRRLVHQNLNRLSWLRTSPARDSFIGFLEAQADILEPDTNPTAESFLQLRQPGAYFRSYAPQSGQIFGVLQQMKDQFEAELPQAQKDELAKQAQFSSMKSAKEAEMSDMADMVEHKSEQLATAKSTLATAKNELDDTKDAVAADQQFLLNLTSKCTEAVHDYETQHKALQEELTAVVDAVALLSKDAVHDAQAVTFGFLQLTEAADSRVRSENAAVGEAFKPLIQAVDKLVAELKLQQEDEVKHKDFCSAELHDNDVHTQRKSQEQEQLEAELASLAEENKSMTLEVSTLRGEIDELHGQLQRATLDRKAENLAFQSELASQQTTMSALKAAREKLVAVYQKSAAALLQAHPKSQSVVLLIEKLIGETTVIQDDTRHKEQNAQSAYEALVEETNKSVKFKARLAADKLEELARIDEDTAAASANRDEAVTALADLSEAKGGLLKQCTFLLNNFDARQAARSAEMDGLNQVKAILLGMASS